MIPKIIHYCWFGGNELPEMAVRCIDSWKKYFPDYKIKEWNEHNFNVNICDYTREAYNSKKWAFVSDYARFWILYHEGGIYFDTDVEVIKEFKPILDCGSFMGCEKSDLYSDENLLVNMANPGLGLGANPGLGLFKEVLDYYDSVHFLNEDGTMNLTTVVKRTTDILLIHGFNPLCENIQMIKGVSVYPAEYFCPMDYLTGELVITENTFSVHHYAASWHNKYQEGAHHIRIYLERLLGRKWGKRIGDICVLPLKIANEFDELGFIRFCKFALCRIKKILSSNWKK